MLLALQEATSEHAEAGLRTRLQRHVIDLLAVEPFAGGHESKRPTEADRSTRFHGRVQIRPTRMLPNEVDDEQHRGPTVPAAESGVDQQPPKEKRHGYSG